MQQGELLSKREVVEHKLAPRPNRRANRPVQSIREVRRRAACSTAAISASTYAIQFLPATGYRSCLGLLRLGKRYGPERVQAALHRSSRLV